jgi:hypothetical protein
MGGSREPDDADAVASPASVAVAVAFDRIPKAIPG